MFSPISVLAKTEPSGFLSAEYILRYFYTVCKETQMTQFIRLIFNRVSFQSHEQASRTADLKRDCCAQCSEKDVSEVHKGKPPWIRRANSQKYAALRSPTPKYVTATKTGKD